MTEPIDALPPLDSPAGNTEHDRPLLAILLAHQRRSWRRGERLSVEVYLEQRSELQGDAETVLDLIYNEIVLREEAGESPRLEEYVGRFPHLAHQLGLQFDVEGVLRSESPVGAVEDWTVFTGQFPPPEAVGRSDVAGYEILGELGRGGMGIVYKARQLRLNRIVALKMILAGEHAPAEAAIRFLGEAEAVARLNHPNIIQVFAFGDHRGLPYFEMEYVAGGSLADRLKGALRPPSEAAQLIETLARAIHEVHRLGIVHRDLKPANVLLADDGSPRIADFGLAKWMDVETGLTRTDHVLGSPSYMAPEQAVRGACPIGPAADVYSLGAILYELLTGRPPFREATVLETLEQVKSAEPVPPTRLRPGLPGDLVTICLKCLRKEPSRRYEGAHALAEDLRRFTAGEPIMARPVGAIERIWRWSHREPALAALAVALLAGLVAGATQWWRAESHLAEELHLRGIAEENVLLQTRINQELLQANDRVDRARRRAQERLDVAMKALENFEGITNDAALLREPRLEGLRAKLFRTALGFYRDLQASLENEASPETRGQLSAAYSRIADISWQLGLREEALATHRQALALIEQMAAATPTAPNVRAAVARGHARIGFTLRTMGRSAEALPSYKRARGIQEALAREDPADPRYRETLSWTLSNIGLIYHELGRLSEAIRLHRQAIAIHESLVESDPGNSAYRSDLAWCWRYLGQALAASGERDEALRILERAVESLQTIVEAHPGEDEHRWRRARCRDEIGSILLRTGRPTEAAVPLDQAAEVLEGLARDNPALYRGDLARNCLYVASQRAATGRPEEALASIRRAEDLLDQSPTVPAGTLYELACSYSLWSASGTPGSPTTTEQEARGDQAMAALRRAVAAGFDDLGQIQHDPTLSPLRLRRDFQDLLMDLSFPADPF
jgi:eukaryotic-like serine/threonine-protein kinase